MSFSNLIVDSKNKNSIKFEINNVDKSLVNTIRRISISEISTVAFKTEPITENDIKIIENTSSLHNEFLSHRIGMTPLFIPEEEIEEYDSNKYEFILDEFNQTNDILEITTEHFKIKKEDGSFLSKEQVKKILPPDIYTGDYMIINRLKPDITGNNNGEKMNLVAKAIKSNGLKNARWSPIETSVYNFKRDINEGMKHYDIEIEKINSMRKDKGQDLLTKKEEEDILNRFKVHNFDRYFQLNEYGEPNVFEYRLITINLSPFYVIDKSLENLINKLKYIKLETESFESNVVEIVDCENKRIKNCCDIIIKNEGHTLGNLLQSYINIFNFNMKKSDVKIDIVGYKCPHPLEKKIVLRIKPTIDEDIDDTIDIYNLVRNILINSCNHLIKIVEDLKINWNSFIKNKDKEKEEEILVLEDKSSKKNK